MAEEKPISTIYQLEEIISRALEECKQAGYIGTMRYTAFPPSGTGDPVIVPTILNVQSLVQHLSKTIIGELYEFEIIRKIGPIFRAMRILEQDFAKLDEQQSADFRRQNLRVGDNLG